MPRSRRAWVIAAIVTGLISGCASTPPTPSTAPGVTAQPPASPAVTSTPTVPTAPPTAVPTAVPATGVPVPPPTAVPQSTPVPMGGVFPSEILGMPVQTVAAAATVIDSGRLDGREMAVAGYVYWPNNWCSTVFYPGFLETNCDDPELLGAPSDNNAPYLHLVRAGRPGTTSRATTDGKGGSRASRRAPSTSWGPSPPRNRSMTTLAGASRRLCPARGPATTTPCDSTWRTSSMKVSRST